jgi:hypothetical protein
MDPLDIHGSIHGFIDVDVPLGSMDVDVTNIHGYPSSAFTDSSGDEGTQMERHIHQCKLYDLLRPSYAFLVSLEFPHLFKEPASYREFREEWDPNEYGRYSIVPCAIRRDILVRLIDARVEEMKKRDLDNIRRNFATNPIPSNKRRASSSETDDTPSKRPRPEVTSTSDPERGRPYPYNPGDKKSAD